MSDTDGNSEGTNNAFDGGSEVSSPPPASEAPVSSPSSSNGGGGGQVRRSTICAICSEDTGNYHLNYGASACYSCRAFFRRAIQKDRNPQFICKRGGGCEVNMKTRRSCQRCRYDLCLGAGMKSDAVMRDDEKQHRFKKSIQKKARVAQVAERQTSATAATGRRASASSDSGGGRTAPAESRLPQRVAPEPSTPTAMPTLLPVGMGGFPVQRSPPEFNPYNNKQVLLDQEIKQEDDAVSLGSGSGNSEEYRAEDAWHSLLRSQQHQQFYLKQRQQQQQQQLQQQQRFTASYPYLAEMSSMQLPSPPSAMTSSVHPVAPLPVPPPPPILVPPPPFLRPQLSPYAEQPAAMFRSHSNGSGHSEDNMDIMDMMLAEDDDVKPSAAVAVAVVRPLMKASRSEELIAERGEWRNFDLFRQAQSAWMEAVKESEMDDNFRASMINLHTGFAMLTKAQLSGHMAYFDAVFKSFAGKIDDFQSLGVGDQSILLRRNSPHFVQYVLARYFYADSGSEQLSWMLPNFFASQVQAGLKRFSFDDFNDLVELMVGHGAALYDRMNQGVVNNAQAAGLMLEDNCVVALACLYSSNSFSSLNEPERVKRLKDLVTGCHPKYDALKGLTGILDNSIFLSSLFGGSTDPGYCQIDGSDSPDRQELYQMDILKRSPGPTTLAPHYTNTEEKWLDDRMVDFDCIMKGVSFGDDAIGEFARFSLDEPLSKSFFPESIHIFRERFYRVLSSHSEFKELQEAEQHVHLGQTLFPALAITFARGETCTSGVDQLEFYGQLDLVCLEKYSSMSPLLQPKRLKKIDIKSLNDATRMMDAKTLEEYQNFCHRLKKLVQHHDQRIYKLLCLATMFQKETRMQPYTSLSPMGERYALVLQRRLINELGSETGKMYYQSFVQGLDIVREFAALLRRVMGPMMDPANIRMMQQLQQQQLLQQQR